MDPKHNDETHALIEPPDGGMLGDRQRTKNWQFIALWAAFMIASVVFPGSPADGIVFCPFRGLTGLSCPGCGMTRSCTHFMHGDFWSSIEYHPMGWLLITWMTTSALLRVVENVRGRSLDLPWPEARARGRRGLMYGAAIFLLLFGGLRLVLEIAGILTPV